MRAQTKIKGFAIVIGVAAAGVMALGAQTTAAGPPDVVEYDTRVTISQYPNRPHRLFHGRVNSALKRCRPGRRVVMFEPRPGADRRLHTGLSRRLGVWVFSNSRAHWQGNHVYVLVTRKVGNGYVCRADRSKIYEVF